MVRSAGNPGWVGSQLTPTPLPWLSPGLGGRVKGLQRLIPFRAPPQWFGGGGRGYKETLPLEPSSWGGGGGLQGPPAAQSKFFGSPAASEGTSEASPAEAVPDTMMSHLPPPHPPLLLCGSAPLTAIPRTSEVGFPSVWTRTVATTPGSQGEGPAKEGACNRRSQLVFGPPPPPGALIRPSGEDAMGRSCILDSPPRQGDARGSADARSSADACLS